jgi:hypothetical protein
MRNVPKQNVFTKGGIAMKKHDVPKPNVQELEARRDIEGLIQALKYKEALVRLSSTEALRIRAEMELHCSPPPPYEDIDDSYPPPDAGNEDENAKQRKEWRIFNKIRGDYSRMSLKGIFEDRDWCIRGTAALALGLIRDASAVTPLIQALHDEDSYVRGEAALALGRIKDERAVEPLTRALEDEDKYVQMTAACALGMLMDKVPAKPSPALKGQLEAKGVDE